MASVDADSRALGVLVGNHRRFLAFLERRLGDRALAEDVLQDAFVRGMDRLGDVRDDESVVAWFYRVLRNAVIDRQRRAASAGRALTAFAAELAAEAPAGELHAEACRCVGELATTLSPGYREALQRVELDGVAVKDFAAEAGITRGNAAVRLHRARAALRAEVVRACGTCAEHGCLDCSCGRGAP